MAAGLLLRLVVALVFVFLLLPIASVVVSSFSASPMLAFPPRALTFEWYGKIPKEFVDALKVSLIAATATAVVATLAGVGIGLAIARGRNRGKAALNAVSVAPLTVPHLVMGIALYHTSLFVWDVTGVEIMETMAGLVLAHVVIAVPFVVRGVVAGHAHFDRALEEAALSLGASNWQTLRIVTLPLLLPGILSGAFFAFLVSFDDVPVALFMGGGPTTTTLPLKILSSIEFSLNADVMAISTLIIGASLAVMVVLERAVGLDRFFGAGRS